MRNKIRGSAEKWCWNYIGVYPTIPAARKFVARTKRGCYSLYPAIEVDGGATGYILVLREQDDECDVATWWEYGDPETVDPLWLEYDKKAKDVLKRAKKMLRNAWKNL